MASSSELPAMLRTLVTLYPEAITVRRVTCHPTLWLHRSQSTAVVPSDATSTSVLPTSNVDYQYYIPKSRPPGAGQTLTVQGRTVPFDFGAIRPAPTWKGQIKVPNAPELPYMIQDPLVPIDFDARPESERAVPMWNKLQVMRHPSNQRLFRKLEARKLRRKHLFDSGLLRMPFDIIFANLQSLEEIQAAIEENRKRLTGKHIVAALYRCVQLNAKPDKDWLRSMCLQLRYKRYHFKPRHFRNVWVALGKLNFPHYQTLRVLSGLIVDLNWTRDFHEHYLCQVAYYSAKMNFWDKRLMDKIAFEIRRRAMYRASWMNHQRLKPRDFANILMAYALLNYRNQNLFEGFSVALNMKGRFEQFKSVDLHRFLLAMAVLQWRQHVILKNLVYELKRDSRIDDVNTEGLVRIVYSLGALSFSSPELLDTVTEMLIQPNHLDALKPYEMAMVAYGLGRQVERCQFTAPPALCEHLESRLLAPTLSDFGEKKKALSLLGPLELGQVSAGFGLLGKTSGILAEVAGELEERGPQHFQGPHLALLLEGFKAADYRSQPSLLKSLAARTLQLVDTMEPTELCTIVNALGALKVEHPELSAKVASLLVTTSQREAIHQRSIDRPAPIALIDGVDLDDSSVWEDQTWGPQGPPQILGHVSRALTEGDYSTDEFRDKREEQTSQQPEIDGDSASEAGTMGDNGDSSSSTERGLGKGGQINGTTAIARTPTGGGVAARHPTRDSEPSDYAPSGYAAQSYKAPLLKPKSDEEVDPVPLEGKGTYEQKPGVYVNMGLEWRYDPITYRWDRAPPEPENSETVSLLSKLRWREVVSLSEGLFGMGHVDKATWLVLGREFLLKKRHVVENEGKIGTDPLVYKTKLYPAPHVLLSNDVNQGVTCKRPYSKSPQEVQDALELFRKLPPTIPQHPQLQSKLEELLNRQDAHQVAKAQMKEQIHTREYMYDLKGPELWPHERFARREWFKELVPEFEPPTKFPGPFGPWKALPPGFWKKLKDFSYSPRKDDAQYKM